MKKRKHFTLLLSFLIIIMLGCEPSTTIETEGNTNQTLTGEGLNIPSASHSNSNTVITVSGDTFDPTEYSGWLFNRDQSTRTPYLFTTDEAQIGFGSLYIEPITNSINGDSDKFIGELYLNEEVANIESISYDFLIGSGGTAADENHFYLNVYANFGESDPFKFYDCRYNMVPATGSTSDWTTITFDLTQPYSVTTRGSSPHTCPSVPADMDNLSSGSTIRVAALNVGDTSDNDQGLDGYYDKVVVNRVSGTTVYNFEAVPTKKSDCKKGGWKDYGFKNQGQCIRYVNTGKDSR